MRAERASKPAQERQKVEHRTWTQEELLEEAKETEYWNLIDLERLLTLEAEMKKKAPTVSNAYEGPSLVYRSSAKVDEGATMIELARGAETPEPLRQNKPTPAHKDKCVITGLPAKYKDPVTGMPYATIEAFKKVRARYPPLPPKPKPAPEEPDAAAAAPIEPKIEVVVDVPMEPEAPCGAEAESEKHKETTGETVGVSIVHGGEENPRNGEENFKARARGRDHDRRRRRGARGVEFKSVHIIESRSSVRIISRRSSRITGSIDLTRPLASASSRATHPYRR